METFFVLHPLKRKFKNLLFINDGIKLRKFFLFIKFFIATEILKNTFKRDKKSGNAFTKVLVDVSQYVLQSRNLAPTNQEHA